MEAHYRIALLIALCALTCGANMPTTKEVRTGSLLFPEKIIGGVIEMVHSHKSKSTTQAPYTQYPQQYPQYQQWIGQGNGQGNAQGNGQGNYQNPGYSQYQGQNQYYAQQNGYQGYQNGHTGPSSQTYPNQGFSNSQNQNQNQYQTNYQPNGNYQQTQQFQTQGTGQYQGQSGYYGQNGQSMVSQTSNVGHGGGQGFQASGSQVTGSSPGPTCVCQAWTKPQHDELKDGPGTQKMEKNQHSNE